ncbi:hypothetical protein N7983_07605 [Priestia megaterium]|uniref:hypothetical protein n=1 Tax=Priestia megaterium TaxID=1404 RepID=UPI0021D67A96|nr:hypothetical protein [Priestia megaterium]MCU7743033.1 hypothetical protein [Priestia megaterium]MEE3894327.1 hypothetical protein [Priestia megaterium]
MNFRQLSLVIVFSCILILLASCSEEDKSLRFEGESENWKSQYFLTQDKDKENGEGSIIYKGPNKDNIGEVTYKIEGSYGSIDVTSTPVDGKMGINDACEGCAKQDSSDPFHVTIKWDGKTEKFDLKAK